jgi:hypothetical protein
MSEEPKPINVYEYVAIVLDQTASIAWQKLGLQPDMATGRTEADLPQAKVAIDLCGQLAEILRSQLEGDDLRQVNNLMNDLRINFMQRTQ